tara:strand:- start:27 stop:509 length:483 start_codon:yes stop_codon:yes gene_type:complete
MYLLYSKNKEIFFSIVISFILILLQGFLPIIALSEGLIITCDLFFIFLTFLAFNNSLYKVVIFAFFFGIFQDLVIQPETVGLSAFIKLVSVFFINYLNKIKELWSELASISYLFLIYFFHYFLYHFVFVNELSSLVVGFIFLETIFNLVIYIICDKIIFN